MRNEPFVAVGLLTQRDLDVLGSGFHRAFPLGETAGFEPLRKRIDEAMRRLAEVRHLAKGSGWVAIGRKARRMPLSYRAMRL